LNSYPHWWDTVPGSRGADNAQSATKPREPGTLEPGTLEPGTFDVAVIGAGYTGLAAARQLARSGASVVVLERERAGWGASSRNGGQVLTGLKLDPATLVARYGESRARALFDASLESMSFLESLLHDETIDCEYERTGHIQAAWKAAHFDHFRDEQALLTGVFNHPVTLVARADQAAELGTGRYHGLLIDERSAALNPAKYVQGLLGAAVRAGAVVAEHVGVLELTRAAGAWIVKTTAGEVRASDVFVATNGYTSAVTPALQRRLIPIGSYIVATQPLPPATAARLIPRRRMVFDSKNFLYYFRLTSDHRLMFGGRAEFSGPTLESAKRASAILHHGMATIFPELARTPIDYAWSGHVAFTRDQLPHAGRLDGAYYAAGYSGHGIAMATYLGSLMARRIAGETFEHPLIDGPFPAIPLYDGRPWFLPLVGAYYRFRDWLD
jgi:glycine/D-amino acid oxidase-like deaminating enzyme